MKVYEVEIYTKWPEHIIVRAATAAEARKKAWNKFKKRLSRRLFEVEANEI